MTILEAKRICSDYYNMTNPSEEDTFLYTEALKFLIEEAKDADYMVELGGLYYEDRQFDLALKYYELAAEYNNLYAISNLGYIWYYGRTGERNYEKAFYYFDKARQMGDFIAAYKVADMYKNGYYVEKDYEKYKTIIEDLYSMVKNARRLNEPLPEIFTRLAKICDGYASFAYQRRNEWMVDRSSRVIAVYNGEPSGTRNTINYAKKVDVPVVLIQG